MVENRAGGNVGHALAMPQPVPTGAAGDPAPATPMPRLLDHGRDIEPPPDHHAEVAWKIQSEYNDDDSCAAGLSPNNDPRRTASVASKPT